MSCKLIVAKDKEIVYCALIDNDKRLVELNVSKDNSNDLIGKIIIGKVINVVKGMNAAFVNIGLDKNAYMSLDSSLDIHYTKRNSNNKISNGDEIVVQIEKDAFGTKGCVVTPNISLTGRYVVLTKGKNFIGLSNKIRQPEEKKRLKTLVEPYITDEYGFIIRTNANNKDSDIIEMEIKELIEKYTNIMNIANYRTCYTEIYSGISSVLKSIRDMNDRNIDEYIIEDNDIYNQVYEYVQQSNSNLVDKLTLYQDNNLSLFNLYGLKSKINKALNEKIWLKSGGCIVIQPTEALVSIDVNTAKFTGKKNLQDTIFKTNIEAAKEIAYQLRLRNLSGIIIVDFIDMKKEEHNIQLLEKFKLYLSSDRNKVYLMGMTKLGLVEITRKKTNKPLYEQMKEL
ncbi:MAG: ribonuclease E/G [Vallitalea sp.]|jgi:ribonuclease G|nr:ribonuclease E/G [Vallitalea sp.]